MPPSAASPQRVLAPMLATAAASVDALPGDGDRWVYEVKWDGVRVLAHVPPQGGVRLVSRAGNDVSAGYPELGGLADLAGVAPVVLDGEVVVLRDGVPSFAALAERMHLRDAARVRAMAAASPATYFAFDVLVLQGRDVTALPWHERRALLESLAPLARDWQLSPTFDDRDAVVAATLESGLEGVVAKRRTSRYAAGARPGDWVKLAHKRIFTGVIGGWRWETGGRDRLGSVLVGRPDDAGGLPFAGRVGSGLTAASARDLRRVLEAVPRVSSPFTTEVPVEDARQTTWCEPVVRVRVRHLGNRWTSEGGRLRQPVFVSWESPDG